MPPMLLHATQWADHDIRLLQLFSHPQITTPVGIVNLPLFDLLLLFILHNYLFMISEGVKKSKPNIQSKGRMDWRSFRAQPIKV